MSPPLTSRCRREYLVGNMPIKGGNQRLAPVDLIQLIRASAISNGCSGYSSSGRPARGREARLADRSARNPRSDAAVAPGPGMEDVVRISSEWGVLRRVDVSGTRWDTLMWILSAIEGMRWTTFVGS